MVQWKMNFHAYKRLIPCKCLEYRCPVNHAMALIVVHLNRISAVLEKHHIGRAGHGYWALSKFGLGEELLWRFKQLYLREDTTFPTVPSHFYGVRKEAMAVKLEPNDELRAATKRRWLCRTGVVEAQFQVEDFPTGSGPFDNGWQGGSKPDYFFFG